MAPLIVICGPTVAGKTTVGTLVARRLGFRHLEMSDFALAGKGSYELAEGPISTLDYVERVLWRGGEWDVVVRAMSSHMASAGLVVTGPRRAEEIEALVAKRFDVDLIYLHVPLHIRLARALKDATKNALPEVLVARTSREASWGLLDRPSRLPFRVVPNAGNIGDAVAAIVAPYEIKR
jgi:adenylate kinase family enzyme